MTETNPPTDFPGWSAVFGRCAGAFAVLLLLDFDGTLSDIVQDPAMAVLRKGNTRTLDMLIIKPGYAVGIVSGRSLDDVMKRVALPNLIYAGNHGMEIHAPGLRFVHPDVATYMPGLAEIASRLRLVLAEIPGAHVEDKTLTLTVHFRRTPAQYHEKISALVGAIVQQPPMFGRYRITHAKAAIEVRPAVDWHKGLALELIRSRLHPRAFPIYIGDDRTDEDAFRAAQDAGGCGIFVGPAYSPTGANFRLDSPAAVSAVLTDLVSR